MNLLSRLSNNFYLKKISSVLFKKLFDTLEQSNDKQLLPEQSKETWLFFTYKLLILLAGLLILSLITKYPVFIMIGFFIVSIIVTGKLFVILDDNYKGFAFGAFTVHFIDIFNLTDNPEVGILSVANKISAISDSLLVAFGMHPKYAVDITSFIWLYLFFLIMLGIQDLIRPLFRSRKKI